MKGYTQSISRRRVKAMARHIENLNDVTAIENDVNSMADSEFGKGVVVLAKGAVYVRDDMYTPCNCEDRMLHIIAECAGTAEVAGR